MNRRAVGGEAGLLGLPSRSLAAVDLTKGIRGRWTSSGRAALSVVLHSLRERGVRHIHLPSFICQSVVFTVRANGLACSFYPVDMELGLLPDPPKASAVLFVDYFGWRNAAMVSFLGRSSLPLVEDASQAFLSGWQPPRQDGHYLVLSPRKLAPTVLGGWCNVPGAALPSAPAELESLAWRSVAARLAKQAYMSHPRSMVDAGLEQFYLGSFAALEKYLDGHCEPSAPPGFVQDFINWIPWRHVARKRRRNWLALHDSLEGKLEPMFSDLPGDVVPLGYVVRVPNRDRVRRRLAEHRIFCPVHWPLPVEVSRRRFPLAGRLADRCLTLPVDQRYGESDMCKVAKVVAKVL